MSNLSKLPHQTTIMRQRAMAQVCQVKRVQPAPSFSEEEYLKTIDQLEGTSFSPLAGITMTFQKPMATATSLAIQPDAYFYGDYVEYATGFKLRLIVTADLDEGYYPLGVSKEALHAATRQGIESLVNECGYSLDENSLPGLRGFGYTYFGNDRLDAFTELDERIFNAVNFGAWPEIITYIETETALTFNTVCDRFINQILLPGDSNRYGEVLMIRRESAGQLSSLIGSRLWTFDPDGGSRYTADGTRVDGTDVITKLRPLEHDTIDTFTGWNEMTPKERERRMRDIHHTIPNLCFEFHAFDPNKNKPSDRHHHRYDNLDWKDGVLSLGVLKDWKENTLGPVEQHIHIADPDGWMMVVIRRVEIFGNQYRPAQSNEPTMGAMKRLDHRLEEIQVIETPFEPTPDPNSLDQIPPERVSIPSQYTKAPGLWTRLSRAWASFWSDEPTPR